MPTRERITRLPFLVIVYAIARASAVWGLTPQRFPDTEGYLHLSFLSPTSRLWPVPLVYAVVADDALRVAVHVVAGVLAWALLASVLSRSSRFPGAVRILVLVVGLAPQVIRYDLTILSESLAISLAVATVALLVRAADRGTPDLLLALVAVVFCMTRPQHLLFLFSAAVVITARAALRKKAPGAVGIILVIAAVPGLVMLRANRPMSELNMYTVLMNRVINDDARFAWFTSHGMPDIPGMRESRTYEYVLELPEDLRTFLNLPPEQRAPTLVHVGGLDLAQWVRSSGWRTYLSYLFAYPREMRLELNKFADPALNPSGAKFLTLETRSIVPELAVPSWQLCAMVTAVGLVFSIGARQQYRARVLLLVSFVTATLYAVSILLSGIEHARHASTAAVLVRVCALVAVSMTVRRDKTPEPDAPTTV